MMDGGPVRNMWSTVSNKFEKLCISLAFITIIYNDARSSECKISREILSYVGNWIEYQHISNYSSDM